MYALLHLVLDSLSSFTGVWLWLTVALSLRHAAFAFGYGLEAFKMDVFVPIEQTGVLANVTNGTILFVGTESDFIIPLSPSPSPLHSKNSYVFGSLIGTIAFGIGVSATVSMLLVAAALLIRRRRRITMYV